MQQLFIFALVVIVILVIKYFSSNRTSSDKDKNTKADYRYIRKEYFMRRDEHEFFDMLVGILGDNYYVFPQVHLPTVINIDEHDHRRYHGAFRSIDEKSVDYVICDKVYIKPLIAIELDGPSHNSYIRKLRDKKVERIFMEAGIPLLRFISPNHLVKEEVEKCITEAIPIQ